MSNTLTNLIPDLYESLDVVSREMVGFIPAVTHDASAERAALNEAVRSPVAPAAAAEDITPGQLPPDDGDQVIGNASITITKSRTVPFRWTGEEQKGIKNGPGYHNIRINQIAQAMRTLVNEMEVDLGGLFKYASRAYGTEGTAPFASDLSATAQILKILKDNGAPMTDLHLVVDTTAGAKIRTLTQLTKANEAGTDATLRRGILLDIHNFSIRESAGVTLHTAGTGTGYLVNHSGGYSAGTTSLAVDTGSGTILAGDFVTLPASGDKYIIPAALAASTLTLNAPGLRIAAADNDAITVGGSFTANLGFSRNALVLSTRLPALPEEGDMADDRTIIVDPISGLAFEVAMYKQYRRVRYEISAAWGVANFKPEHSVVLLG